MRGAALLLAILLMAGCTREELDPPPATTPGSPTPSGGPPLVFGGVVRDAVTGEVLRDATVRVDLAQVQPCERQGIGWTSYDPAHDNGTWGPLTVPRPRSDDVAFFLHARAPGHSENATHIGPAQARGDLGNLTILLHPEGDIAGQAPPGTLVALDAPGFPRFALADAEGAFVFEHARASEAWLVAATDVPQRLLAASPANVTIPDPGARGWLLEGIVKGPSGAPLAADVVAWNGTLLWSAARASASGVFALPLPPEPASLRIEARTADARYGGILTLEIAGPPALRETILAKARC